MNEAVGINNRFKMGGGGKRIVRFSEVKSYGNLLVMFYCQLPMGGKYTSF